MTPELFISTLDALYGGRRDGYAEGYPSPSNPKKYRWVHRDEPVTPEVWESHLRGDVAIALYQLDCADSVQWIAMDFDGADEDDQLAFQKSWADAVAQRDAFSLQGVTTHLERSRSGRGVHLWGFFEEPISAKVARAALFPYLVDADTADKLYPVQTKLTAAKPLGNHLALPFFGKAVKQGNSTVLDLTGTPIPRVAALRLLTETRISTHTIEQLASRHPTAGLAANGDASYGDGPVLLASDVTAEPHGFLKLVSPYGCDFVRHSVEHRATIREPQWYAALQVATQYAEGRKIAHVISQGHPGYDPRETDEKYNHALTQPRIGCQWIHQHYPELACKTCPMKAPHWKARKSLLEIATTDTTGLVRAGSGRGDLDRIRAYDSGERQSGVAWGLKALDQVMRLRSSEYIVFGARPSIGKTSFLLDRAIDLSRRGIPTFVFSAETGELGIRDRLMANIAGIDSRLLRGEGSRRLYTTEWDALEAAADELETLPLYLDYATQSPEQMLIQMEHALLDSGAPIDSPFTMFFDYLQFGLKQQGETTTETVGRLSTEFKYLAKVSKNPTVVLSQLRREAEGEEGDMTSVRDSGKIEQDADAIMLLNGERVEGGKVVRTILIPKQRDGVANVRVALRLDQPTGRFEDLSVETVENPFGDGE